MTSALGFASLAFEYAAAAIAPPHCAACDEPVAVLAAFCATCAAAVESAAPPADGHGGQPLAALVYDGPVAQAIVRMKYGGRPDLARPLGDLLWRALAPEASTLRHAIVVPVPLHPMRLAERGFNQSALIARRVAKQLRAPLHALALTRTRDTERQALLEREARLTNVVGAFSVRQRDTIAERDVLLVDDVCTTGATLEAASAALTAAGARTVRRTVVARTV